MVNTGHDGNTNSFITSTLATNCQNRQGNGNTVAFENSTPKVDKQINARLVEIVNQGPPLETMATNRLDCHISDRRQFTNHREHQYQSTYTNQNRSYSNYYNRNSRHTWENYTDRTCNNYGTKGHIVKYCTKTSFWCQWCRQPHMIHRLADPNPGPAHRWSYKVQVVTTQLNHQTSTIFQTTNQYLHTQHSHLQPHQVVRNVDSDFFFTGTS